MKTSGATTTLAVVNPVAVIGPVAGNDPSYSFQLVSRLLAGTVPAVPRLGFSLVDVRDIADLHVRAMTSPAAAGQRFIGENGFFWRLGDDARRVPTRKAPDFLIRFLALFDKSIPASELGERTDFTSEKARTALGWAPRPIEDTIADCGRSLLANGLVRSN